MLRATSEDDEDDGIKSLNYAAVLDDEQQNESGEMTKNSGNFSFSKLKVAISTLSSTANSRFQDSKKAALLNEINNEAAAAAENAGDSKLRFGKFDYISCS